MSAGDEDCVNKHLFSYDTNNNITSSKDEDYEKAGGSGTRGGQSEAQRNEVMPITLIKVKVINEVKHHYPSGPPVPPTLLL